ncbi:MAG: hypothetical protein MHM6MM_008411 [Cercozoa sp. M6MM]
MQLSQSLVALMHSVKATLATSADTVLSSKAADALVTDTITLFDTRTAFARRVEEFAMQRVDSIRQQRQQQLHREQATHATPSYCHTHQRLDSPSVAPIVSTKPLTRRLAIPHNDAVLAQHAFFFAIKHIAICTDRLARALWRMRVLQDMAHAHDAY